MGISGIDKGVPEVASSDSIPSEYPNIRMFFWIYTGDWNAVI